MSTIQDKSKDMANKMLHLDKIHNLVSSTSKLTMIIGCIILFIIGGFVYWNYSLTSIPNKQCSVFKELYINPESINNTGLQNSDFNTDGAGCAAGGCSGSTWANKRLTAATAITEPYLACYRVKTAYNCCALTNFQNTYVNICALEACIAQGYRALDFEVYLIDGKAQIAVSSKPSVHVKTSYNAIPCTNAFTVIKNQAFSNKHCPNYGDPLIIILRIKSNHIACHNSIAAAIETTIKNNLLDIATYGKEGKHANIKYGINGIPVSEFMGKKIIVIVDDSVNGGKLLPARPPTAANNSDPTAQSKLWQYTHGSVGTDNKQVMVTSYSDILNSDREAVINNARNKMMIVNPDYSPNARSVQIVGGENTAMKWYGTQLSGTCNQSVLDAVKLANDNYFKSFERAWIMRDPKYLPQNRTVAAPAPPPANEIFKPNLGGAVDKLLRL